MTSQEERRAIAFRADESNDKARNVGLGFMTEVQSNPPMCSIAALMLFGKTTRRFLWQAGIRLISGEIEVPVGAEAWAPS